MVNAREDFGQLGSDQLMRMPETRLQIVAAHGIETYVLTEWSGRSHPERSPPRSPLHLHVVPKHWLAVAESRLVILRAENVGKRKRN